MKADFSSPFNAAIVAGKGSTNATALTKALTSANDAVTKAIKDVTNAKPDAATKAAHDKLLTDLTGLQSDIKTAAGSSTLTSGFFKNEPSAVKTAVTGINDQFTALKLTGCQIMFG